MLGAGRLLGLNPGLFSFAAYLSLGGALFFLFRGRWRTVFRLSGLSLALLLAGRLGFLDWRYQDVLETPPPLGEYLSLRGKLADFPHLEAGNSVFLLQVDAISRGRESRRVNLGVRLKVNGDLRHLYRGERVAVEARLTRPPSGRNFEPGHLDSYSFARNIHYFGHSKSALLVEPEQDTAWYWRLLGLWRSKIRRALDGIDQNSAGRAFLQAVLLGDRGLINPELKENLLAAGVFHLLAISGAHIGALALIFLWLGKRLGLSRSKRYLAAGGILLVYLALSGFSVSAQRAVLVALCLFFARAGDFQADAANLLAAAALLMLMIDPRQILDPGFVLTFTLAASILAGRNLFLPLFKKWPGFSAEIFSANISVFLLSSFLSLHYFNRFSMAALFSGLLLVPVGGFLLALALPLIFMAPLWPSLAAWYAGLLDQPMRVFFGVVELLAGLNWQVFRPALPLVLILAALALFFLSSLAGLQGRARILLMLLFLGFFLLQLAGLPRHRPGDLEAVFLDVGQGDAALVVFPGGKALLLDGGGTAFSDFSSGRSVVLPFILRHRIKVDWVAVSHYHADHAEGVAEIFSALKPKELWLSSRVKGNQYYERLLESLPASTAVVPVNSGFSRRVEDYTITCLFPEKFITAEQTHNNHSQVFKIEGRGRALLFCGDIERDAEEKLLALHGDNLRADLIKVPHHGSRSSSSPDFLASVRPGLAVFSLSEFNSFAFPHRETVKNYQRIGSGLLMTSRRGGIIIRNSDQGLSVTSSK